MHKATRYERWKKRVQVIVPWQRAMVALRLRLRKNGDFFGGIVSAPVYHSHSQCLLWLNLKTRKSNLVCMCSLPSKLDSPFISRIENPLDNLFAELCLQPGQQSRDINKCAHRKSFHTCILFRSMVHHFNVLFLYFYFPRRRFQFHRKSSSIFFFRWTSKSSCNQNMKSNFLFFVFFFCLRWKHNK